jgi:hypothetical protein
MNPPYDAPSQKLIISEESIYLTTRKLAQ